MEKDCIRLTREEKERLIEFKKSDKFIKAYKLIKEEIGLEERKKTVFPFKGFILLISSCEIFPIGDLSEFLCFYYLCDICCAEGREEEQFSRYICSRYLKFNFANP